MASGKEPTDKEYISLSKSQLKIGGQYVEDLIEGLKEAPLQSIHDKLEEIMSAENKFPDLGETLNYMTGYVLSRTFVAVKYLLHIAKVAEDRRMKKKRF